MTPRGTVTTFFKIFVSLLVTNSATLTINANSALHNLRVASVNKVAIFRNDGVLISMHLVSLNPKLKFGQA